MSMSVVAELVRPACCPSHHSVNGMVHCLGVTGATAQTRHFLRCDLSCLTSFSLCSFSEPGYPGDPKIVNYLIFFKLSLLLLSQLFVVLVAFCALCFYH